MKVDQVWLEKRAKVWLKKMLKHPKLKKKFHGEWVDVQLLKPAAMKLLNKKYLQHDYATDVLSFPVASEFESLGLIGSLAICEGVMRTQAKEAGHSERAVADLLLVHGLLHLAGFDHEHSTRAAKDFRTWEGVFLKSKGLIERAGKR